METEAQLRRKDPQPTVRASPVATSCLSASTWRLTNKQGSTKFGITPADSGRVKWEFHVPEFTAGDVMVAMHQLVSYY